MDRNKREEVSKKVIDIVAKNKLPNNNKSNGKLIDEIFGNGNI